MDVESGVYVVLHSGMYVDEQVLCGERVLSGRSVLSDDLDYRMNQWITDDDLLLVL